MWVPNHNNKIMKTALFVNWTDKPFTGYWDGKGREVLAGKSVWMPDYLASHFAKHLTNRELLKTDGSGNLIYSNGDKMTSPKFPAQVPIFMELFNKAFFLDENDEKEKTENDIDSLINIANKNKGDDGMPESKEVVNEATLVAPPTQPVETNKPQNPNEPQIINPPTDDGDDEEGGIFPEVPKEKNHV